MLDVFDTLKQMRQDFQEDEKYHNEDSRKTKKRIICAGHQHRQFVRPIMKLCGFVDVSISI